MNLKETIKYLMDMTHGGVDIICKYYPQARDYFGTKQKFKIRVESDPSACWFQKPGNGYWCVTDFGDEGHPLDAIDVTMKEENLDWYSAISYLLQQYGITNGIDKSRRNVFVEERKPDDEVGQFRYISDLFTENDFSLWGKHIEEHHLAELNWHKVSETFEVKEDKVIHKVSNELYPIYVRECHYEEVGVSKVFYKIYEPRASDKQYRFRYAGHKPAHYINGLYEAMHQNKMEEEISAENRQPVVICCGERDAATVKAFGCKPIWFNSETDFPRDNRDMEKLRKLGPDIFFIPDIDYTGITKGKEFALRFPYLKVSWLPMSLKEKKDWRGNPMKDLRDWANLPGNDYETFHNMLDEAPSAIYCETDNKGKFFINTAHLHHFLWLHNFGTFETVENGKEVVKFGRRRGCKLEEITDAKIVVNFLLDNLQRGKTHNKIYNLIDRKRRDLTIDSFTAINRLPYEIIKPKAGKEIIAFENCVVEVTREGFSVLSAKQFKGMIHSSNVINKEFNFPKGLPVEFDYSDSRYPLINILNYDSHLLRLLINTSRVYWNEEYVASGLNIEEYYAKLQWTLNTVFLTEDQVRAQFECLLNKMFAIGYLCSRYKKRSETYAPYFLDLNCTSESSNGRSGKGIIFQLLKIFVNQESFDGRNKSLTEYQHAFDRVTSNTDVLLLNDFQPHITKFDGLYNMISDGMVINPKGKPQFELDYEDSPKVAITSNFILPSSDASTEGRVLYVPVSDYYHKVADDNDYLWDHSPKDDFKIEIGQDYTQNDWNNDFAVILSCIQFYLYCSSMEMRYKAPSNFVTSIRDQSMYSKEFDEWASDYFTADKLGVYIEKQDVIMNYQEVTGDIKGSPQLFKKSLKAWLNQHGFDFNKCEKLDENGRVMRHSPKYNRTMEFFYVTLRTSTNE
jgi:hypothetical protein